MDDWTSEQVPRYRRPWPRILKPPSPPTRCARRPGPGPPCRRQPGDGRPRPERTRRGAAGYGRPRECGDRGTGFRPQPVGRNLAKGKTIGSSSRCPRRRPVPAGIQRHITEANRAFSDDMVRLTARQIDDRDPHRHCRVSGDLTPMPVTGWRSWRRKRRRCATRSCACRNGACRSCPSSRTRRADGRPLGGVRSTARRGRRRPTLMSRFVRARGKVAVIAESIAVRATAWNAAWALMRCWPRPHPTAGAADAGNPWQPGADGRHHRCNVPPADRYRGRLCPVGRGAGATDGLGNLVAPGAATLIAHETQP